MRNHILKFIIAAAVLLGMFMVQGCSLLPKEKVEEIPTLLPPPQERRKLAEVTKGYISETMKKTARATPIKDEFLYFNQSGRVKDILVDYGQQVKEGDILAQLETGDLEYQLKMAGLDLDTAKINIDKLKLEAELSGNVTDYDLKLQEIAYKKTQMNYDRIKQQYEDATMRAPYDGRVTMLQMKPGDQIQAYQEVIRISDPAQLRLVCEMNAADLDKLQPGLTLQLEYRRDQYIPAKITRVPDKSERLPSGEYDRRVFIEADDPSAKFDFMGLYPVVILVRENENALKIDRSAVRSYFGRVYVRKVDGDVVTESNIVTGIENETEVEILEGLEEGDMVQLK